MTEIVAYYRNLSSRRKRICLTMLFFALAFIATVIGSYLPISHQSAQSISTGLNQTLNSGKINGNLTQDIFLNNFRATLTMFIPFVGFFLGFLIFGNTGVALSALASTSGYPVWLGLLALVLSPIFWLEFAVYSIAMAESLWLTRRLIQGCWRELKVTVLLIGLCAATLFVSAMLETWLLTGKVIF